MTAYEDCLGFMLEALERLNRKGIDLNADTGLVADLGLSSLEVMEFIEQIEDHFDISIPLNILPDVNTVGELARKIGELDT